MRLASIAAAVCPAAAAVIIAMCPGVALAASLDLTASELSANYETGTTITLERGEYTDPNVRIGFHAFTDEGRGTYGPYRVGGMLTGETVYGNDTICFHYTNPCSRYHELAKTDFDGGGYRFEGYAVDSSDKIIALGEAIDISSRRARWKLNLVVSDRQEHGLPQAIIKLNPRLAPYGSVDYNVVATAAKSVVYPLRIAIRRLSDGRDVADCPAPHSYTNPNGVSSCSVRAPAGDSYQAYISNKGTPVNEYAQSHAWKLTADKAEDRVINDIDLEYVGLPYQTSSAICEELVFSPKSAQTHTQQSSLSDQQIACEGVSRANGAKSAALAAIIATGVAGTAAVNWLVEGPGHSQDPTATPDVCVKQPEACVAPHPGQQPAPRATQQLVDDIAERIARAGVAQQIADRVAQQCRKALTRIADDSRGCAHLPIFAPGSNAAEARDLDIDAIAHHPPWVALKYRPAADRAGDRGWLDTAQDAGGNLLCDPARRNPQVHCHEYPYSASEQGGGGASPRPYIGLIPAAGNLSEGGSYSTFTSICLNHVRGARFLVLPVPAGIPIKTFKVC